jgi:hypothetical protein
MGYLTGWRAVANPMASAQRFGIGRIVFWRTGANRHLLGYEIILQARFDVLFHVQAVSERAAADTARRQIQATQFRVSRSSSPLLTRVVRTIRGDTSK